MYNVGVMGIWFSVPGATWKARCLMIGMSRWWTIATCNKESESISYIESESMIGMWWTVVATGKKKVEGFCCLAENRSVGFAGPK